MITHFIRGRPIDSGITRAFDPVPLSRSKPAAVASGSFKRSIVGVVDGDAAEGAAVARGRVAFIDPVLPEELVAQRAFRIFRLGQPARRCSVGKSCSLNSW
ncbi:hypothetical protein [Arthrobacter methylotrophus]|uniref:Uncharacterized protein n=1 Tax=Arthrobacter methylotrophus TaxID=121291 RepID=A0ABV5UJH8_9MICC